MGLFSDMRESIESAQAMSGDDPVHVPAQRIDALVADPTSGKQRHRTDYAGTIWFGGRPQMVGKKPLPGADADINSILLLPDSHLYVPGAAEEVQLQASVAVQGAMATSYGGYFQILEGEAALAEDPSGAFAVHLAVRAMLTLPVGLAYRVIVLSDPASVQVSPG